MKEQLIKLIEEQEDEQIINYLYAFSKDFIERYSLQQIAAQCEVKIQSVLQ